MFVHSFLLLLPLLLLCAKVSDGFVLAHNSSITLNVLTALSKAFALFMMNCSANGQAVWPRLFFTTNIKPTRKINRKKICFYFRQENARWEKKTNTKAFWHLNTTCSGILVKFVWRMKISGAFWAYLSGLAWDDFGFRTCDQWREMGGWKWYHCPFHNLFAWSMTLVASNCEQNWRNFNVPKRIENSRTKTVFFSIDHSWWPIAMN